MVNARWCNYTDKSVIRSISSNVQRGSYRDLKSYLLNRTNVSHIIAASRAAGGGARDSLRGWAATPSWDLVYIIGMWRVSDAKMNCKS